jgi:hypothetical protein
VTAAHSPPGRVLRAIGSINSATRTAEQTLLARLFAGVVTRTSLFALWNNVARDLKVAEWAFANYMQPR